MYADDTVIVNTDKDLDMAIEKTETASINIQQWCTLNNIVVNKRKTKHMLVGVPKKGHVEDVMSSINGIASVEHFIYLRVNIDDKGPSINDVMLFQTILDAPPPSPTCHALSCNP